jgi:hypothetical protein
MLGSLGCMVEFTKRHTGFICQSDQPKEALLRQPQTTGERLDGRVAAAVLASEQMFECVLG